VKLAQSRRVRGSEGVEGVEGVGDAAGMATALGPHPNKPMVSKQQQSKKQECLDPCIDELPSSSGGRSYELIKGPLLGLAC
jgi:hypothetical protein